MNRKFLYILLVGLMVASFGLVSNAGAQQAVDFPVGLSEFKVEIPETTLPANTPIHFIFTNKGVIEHEAVLEKAGVEDEALEIGGEAAEVEHITPGQTKDATWTISEPGEYQLACHTPGHYQGGMFVKFTVKPVGRSLFSQPWVWIVAGIVLLLIIGGLVLLMRRRPAKDVPV